MKNDYGNPLLPNARAVFPDLHPEIERLAHVEECDTTS
jgi:hypothetical protein